jgi:HlyD family secretion protein
MTNIYRILVPLLLVILIGVFIVIYWVNKGSDAAPFQLAAAARSDIRVTVSTNGIIEPVDRSEIYASINGFVSRIEKREGSKIARGELLMQLESKELRTALAEATAALLEQKRQARMVLTGPPKEELSELEASIAENEMQLEQRNKELSVEESLYAQGAVSRSALEKLQQERDLARLRMESLKQRKRDLEQRYSPEEKEWEQAKLSELNKQVNLLSEQLEAESVVAPISGLIYSLSVKPGAYVTKGQPLAQIYQPGSVRLRAYVDEPDLGRIHKGQAALIEWDGLADRRWTGRVERPAEQVVALNNRSVGYVLCSIDGEPEELIPNLNVKVEITTSLKENALVVPRSAVFSDEGKFAVLLSQGDRIIAKPVTTGLFTSETIEILGGIREGDFVVLYPAEARAKI